MVVKQQILRAFELKCCGKCSVVYLLNDGLSVSVEVRQLFCRLK